MPFLTKQITFHKSQLLILATFKASLGLYDKTDHAKKFSAFFYVGRKFLKMSNSRILRKSHFNTPIITRGPNFRRRSFLKGVRNLKFGHDIE